MRGPVLNRKLARRFTCKLATLFVVWLTWSGTPCCGYEYASPQAVKKAIEKGKTFILDELKEENAAKAALGVVALLKADVKPTNKSIQDVLKDLVNRCQGEDFKPHNLHTANYEATVYIMAFANSNPEKYSKEIQFLADWLASGQRESGGWDYPNHEHTKQGDVSQTQYAMLGLWEASIAGATVNQAVFDKTARWHLVRQGTEGGFAYRPSTQRLGRPTHSMTAAGVGSLHICRMFLYPSTKDATSSIAGESKSKKKKSDTDRKKFGILEDPDEVKQELENDTVNNTTRGKSVAGNTLNNSIGRGLRWMDLNFVVEQPTGWPMYYLYSLERAMALANIVDNLGDHAWYQEGATHLVDTQKPRGDWGGNGGPVASTAFGLMFLTRATHKTLGRRRSRRKLGGGLLAGGRGLPKNLSATTTVAGTVKQRKMTGPVDELLSVLEDPKNANFFQAQEALVNKVVLGDPKALVGKTDKLLQLASVKNDEVRRTAMWALGRSQDITVVPTLIEALNDPNLDTMVEARNALRFISKRIDGFGLPAQPKSKERKRAVSRWKTWYLTVRPYDEQDDLLTIDK